MATKFYLTCKDHNEAVNLTDNKLNPPTNKDSLKLFLTYHRKHNIVLEIGNIVDPDNVKRWDEVYKEILVKEKDDYVFEKPPLGLQPKWLCAEIRIKEIFSAMNRYYSYKKVIPVEWVEEYNELCKYIEEHNAK